MKTPEELKVIHDLRQVDIGENKICIRDGITIDYHKEALHGFEFFSFRSPECFQEMECFIEYTKGRKAFLDIGASHGIFSLVFVEINKEGKAYAFEPAQRAFEILSHHSLSKKNISCYKRALSDGYGVVEMHEEWDHLVIGAKEGGTIVKCFSGDTFCEDIEPIDTIKVDCEGMELRVLKGLEKTIIKYHPMLFLELHPERVASIGDSVGEILDMLLKWGYKAIDSKTNMSINYEDIKKETTGELRLILI